jgi:hypothetical protein
MSAEKNDKCRIITPEFRVSFPHVFKAQAMPRTNNKPKFSVTMLFPKDSDMAWYKNVVREAKIEKWGTNKNDWPKGLKMPLQDGDDPEVHTIKKSGEVRDGYEGHWVLKASTGEDQAPGIVGRDGKPIIREADFYGGCYARAYVYCYVWEFPKDSKQYGIGFILDHVQKLRDGKSFGGKKPVEQVFGAIAGGADDMEDAEGEEDFV